ncbi:helix-turn-helix transcriptional regulator [Cupriavidus basilensis]
MPLVWDLASLARGQARVEPAMRALLQTMDEHGLRSGVMFSLGAGKGMNHAIVSLSSPHAGREWISDSVLGQSILFGMALHQVWRAPLRTFTRNTRVSGEDAPLTVMQSRVLTCLAAGMSDKEIAIKLHTTAHNVDYHLRLIRRRYGATNRAQLAYIAGRLNLI